MCPSWDPKDQRIIPCHVTPCSASRTGAVIAPALAGITEVVVSNKVCCAVRFLKMFYHLIFLDSFFFVSFFYLLTCLYFNP